MRKRTGTVFMAIGLSALAVALVAGCSGTGTTGGTRTGGGMMGRNQGRESTAGPSGMMGGKGEYIPSAVGERIFSSGVGSDGRAISRTAPAVSEGSLMMGGGGCESCHGAGGRGGTVRMMSGTTIEAPNITYAALVKEGFTDATIKRAIRDGLDEAGKPLEAAMPRWRMSDADADATIVYLKLLPGQ